MWRSLGSQSFFSEFLLVVDHSFRGILLVKPRSCLVKGRRFDVLEHRLPSLVSLELRRSLSLERELRG